VKSSRFRRNLWPMRRDANDDAFFGRPTLTAPHRSGRS
jgi:hypothetical protein